MDNTTPQPCDEWNNRIQPGTIIPASSSECTGEPGDGSKSTAMTQSEMVRLKYGRPAHDDSKSVAKRLWLSLSPKQRQYIVDNYMDTDDGK